MMMTITMIILVEKMTITLMLIKTMMIVMMQTPIKIVTETTHEQYS